MGHVISYGRAGGSRATELKAGSGEPSREPNRRPSHESHERQAGERGWQRRGGGGGWQETRGILERGQGQRRVDADRERVASQLETIPFTNFKIQGALIKLGACSQTSPGHHPSHPGPWSTFLFFSPSEKPTPTPHSPARMPPFAATIAAWTDSQTPAAAGRSRDEMMTMTRTQQQQQHMSSSVPHLPAPPPPPPSYDDSMTAAAVGGQQQQQQQAYDNRRSGSSPAGPTTSMWGSSVVGEDVKKHRCGHVLLDEDVHVQDDDGGGDDEKQAMMRHDTSGQAAVAAVAAPRSLARRQAPVPVHSRCSHGQGQGPRFEPIWLPLPSESRGVSSFLELKDTVNSLQQQQQLQRLEALLRSRDMPADTWTALIADLESAASHSSSSSPSSPPPPPAPTVSAGFDRLSTGFSRATHIALDPIPLVGPLTGSLARMSYCAVSGVTRAAMHVSGVGAVVDAGLRAGAKRKDKQRRGKKKERGRQAEGDSYAGQEEMNAKNRDVGGGVVAAAPNAEEEEAVVVARWNEQVFLRRGIRM